MSAHYNLARLRVLVVDDNSFMRRLICDMLESFGVRQIQQASDGLPARELLQKETFDLVILDWMLQVMDGLRLTEFIRFSNECVNPLVPVIMVTGHTEKWRVQMARDAGVNEYLAKPVTPDDLARRIFSVIEAPREFVRAPGYFGPDRRRHDGRPPQGSERREDDISAVIDKPLTPEDVHRLMRASGSDRS